MESKGKLRKSMESYEKLRITMESLGKLRKAMESYGKLPIEDTWSASFLTQNQKNSNFLNFFNNEP